jgi:hypothetical protein
MVDTSNPEQVGVADVNIGDQDTTEVDRVFSDDQVRLFYIRGQVARFPGAAGVSLDVENPVQLLDSDGKTIGTARVLVADDGQGLVAESIFQYACPERLDLEQGRSLFYHPEMSVKHLYGTPEENNFAAIVVKAHLAEGATPETIAAEVNRQRPRVKLQTFVLAKVTRVMLSPEGAPLTTTPVEVVPQQ